MQAYYSCKQAAASLGVSSSTIKRMCDEGRLPSTRTAGGHRRIPSNAIEAWLREQLVEMETEPPPRRRRNRKTGREGFTNWLAFGDVESAYRECIRNRSSGKSLAKTFDEAIQPAMQEIGNRWQCGDMDVFEEHLCSINLLDVLYQLRRDFVQSLGDTDQVDAIGCVMGSERHDIASLMVELVLRECGLNALSLGSILPGDSLAKAIDRFKPSVVWLSYTMIDDELQAMQEHEKIVEACGAHTRLLIGGQAMTETRRHKFKHDFLGQSLQKLREHVMQELTVVGC